MHPSRPLKIAWIGKKSPNDGNVTYSREITNALARMGHEVTFFHFAQESSEENEVILPYLYKSQPYTIPTMESRKVLTEALMEFKPDIVHASLSLSPMDFSLPEICKSLGVPLIATFHIAFDRRPSFTSGAAYFTYQLYAPLLAKCDSVIIFSKLQKRILRGMGVPARKIKVIPNGVDTDKYFPAISTFKEDIGAKLITTYMGRLSPEKNVDDLIKVFLKLKLPPDYKLVIVGGGLQEKALKRLYGDNPQILFLGFIPEECRRIEILRATDIFVLPSSVEGLSLSLLEAMACGTPTVATDVGADGEVLEGCGIAISPHKLKSQLSFALSLLLENRELRQTLSLQARERIENEYSLQNNLQTLLQLYASHAAKASFAKEAKIV